jgi:PST family polysaccharide transporter
MTRSREGAYKDHHDEAVNLEEKAVKGGVWAAAQTWGSAGISFIISIFIIRLLGPEPFGLFALASVLFVFIQALSIEGFPRFLIQCQRLEEGHLDAAFWTSLGANAFLALVNIVLAGHFASWLKQPLLRPLIYLLSLNFMIISLGDVPRMLLSRGFDFRRLALITVAATVGGGIVGLGMALCGFGVWSIVFQQMAASLIGLVSLWWGCSWRIRFKFPLSHFKELVAFEKNIAGTKACELFGSRAIDFLVGYFLGISALGYYSMGGKLIFSMMQILGGPFYQVAFPFFSRLREDPEKLENALYGIVKLASLFAFPVFFGLIVLMPEFVKGLLGNKWVPAIPVIQALMVMGLAEATCTYWRIVTIVGGRSSWDLKINILNTTASIIAVMLVLHWGITAVAVANTACFYLFLSLRFRAVNILAHIRIIPSFRQYVEPLAGSLVMIACALFVKWVLLKMSVGALSLLAICASTGAVTYAAAILIISPHIFNRLAYLGRLAFER